MNKTVAYIGLGSNLDDPLARLKSALVSLRSTSGISVLSVSSFYTSKPVGPQDQPDYVNAAASIETLLEPLQLLDALQAIELAHDRVRNGERWGARTLDLDILLYGDEIINNERLTVPHPEIQNRAFVLVPLAEINRDLDLPGLDNVESLRRSVDNSDVMILEEGKNE